MLDVFKLVHQQSNWRIQNIIVSSSSFLKFSFFLFLFAVCRTRHRLGHINDQIYELTLANSELFSTNFCDTNKYEEIEMNIGSLELVLAEKEQYDCIPSARSECAKCYVVKTIKIRSLQTLVALLFRARAVSRVKNTIKKAWIDREGILMYCVCKARHAVVTSL